MHQTGSPSHFQDNKVAQVTDGEECGTPKINEPCLKHVDISKELFVALC
jgi:hypothetical protein